MPSFEEMRLIDPIKRALADEKYHTPTPVQQQSIPPALKGRDILAVAQTGTGKTAAFAIPILNALGEVNRKARPWRPYALILSPTRELAVQIADSLATYSRHMHLRISLVYGGVSQSKQVRVLKRGTHILVATPGRLLDLMDQGSIKLDKLEQFVLDEADRMMDMGFMPDIRRVLKSLPKERQSLFFSATMPSDIQEIADQLLTKPKEIRIAPESPSVETINQYVVHTTKQQKKPALYSILKGNDVTQALVFTRTKRMANSLAVQLEKKGFSADAIHGNKSQNARQKSLDRFRRGKTHTLVATDVVARGIDLDSISHVINYDIPDDSESYVHRIGRTGRAGATGTAITFVGREELGWLSAIERLIKKPIDVLETVSTDQPNQGRSKTKEAQKPRRKESNSKRRQSDKSRNQSKADYKEDRPRRKSDRKEKSHRKKFNTPVEHSDRHAKTYEGAIKRLTRKGFGFIASGRASDTYFNKSSLQGVHFNDLEVGYRVTFSIRRGPKGPCAEQVRLQKR